MHISCSQWGRESGARMDFFFFLSLSFFFFFQKKALASSLIIDTRFSGMVQMQALLELGSWSREITSARVF